MNLQVLNAFYRGKEIYGPATDAWYWLDSEQQGAKAVSKDVYQESHSAYPDREDGTGKWVRYDENGRIVKGWDTTEAGTTAALFTGNQSSGKGCCPLPFQFILTLETFAGTDIFSCELICNFPYLSV